MVLFVESQNGECRSWLSAHHSDADSCDSSCNKTKEVIVELFEYRGLVSKKVPIHSVKVMLDDDELYTEKKYTSEWTPCRNESSADRPPDDDNGVTITISFAYTPGGSDSIIYVDYR